MLVPTITIFVRHSRECPHKGNETFKGCKCPKSLRYSYDGKQHRQSAKTRAWTTAEQARRKLEAQFKAAHEAGTQPQLADSPKQTIDRAIKLFVSDKQSQGISEGVVKKYQLELGRLSEFMQQRSKFFPHEITLEDLTEFRAGWEQFYPSSYTRAKVQERLRGFLRYCFELRLIERVPRLSPIKIKEPPTMPFSEEEYSKLLDTIPKVFGAAKGSRVHALVQLMRHSGLAIADAVTLERDELQKDDRQGLYRVVTKRTKTKVHVSVPIPPKVAEEVLAVYNDNPRYFFWSTGNGQPQTAVKKWHHDLRRLLNKAGMSEYRPHSLRDTFAVSLLEKGIPLEEVSKLLGHESIKTTEKSYSPWVKSRQDRLDSLVLATF